MYETILSETILTRLIAYEQNMSDTKYRSHSGADRTDAEFHRLMAKFWRGLWNMSPDVATGLSELRRSWASFATEMNAKVDAAPKIATGPSRGHSVISHRWADPNKVDSAIPRIAAGLRQLGLEYVDPDVTQNMSSGAAK